jgi:hypothetical protein
VGNFLVFHHSNEKKKLSIAWKNPEDSWEERLLNSQAFRERIAQARQHLREGKGISIEHLRAKYRC